MKFSSRDWVIIGVMFVAHIFLFCGLYQNERQREHIEHLEEYIRDNQLPVPAWPIRDGEAVFEINVPICQRGEA